MYERFDLPALFELTEKEGKEIFARMQYYKTIKGNMSDFIQKVVDESTIDGAMAYKYVVLGMMLAQNQMQGEMQETMKGFKDLMGGGK